MKFTGSASILVLFVILTAILLSCKSGPDGDQPLFSLMDASQTGIQFVNQVDYTEQFNTYTYRNFYNGAGVGIADFNNDGLSDIYFCGNLKENRLYINKGNFVFEDVTEKAGVACNNVWCTGVSIVDINADGWQDIYVCKSGKPDAPHRYNELFINNGNLTFTEKATEYGLDVNGLSNHASFFDYDRDGDLDCYLLSNSFQSVTEFDMKSGQREIRDSLGGNRLYRNDNGHFTDVSRESGIYGSKIGFGLGVSVGDINHDGWPDIYISNDFFERDYLYINNHDGTFKECLEDEMTEISLGAMGADIADLNNDAFPEIFATEMTPENNSRYKTKALFEDWDRYQMKLNNGYYRQFARNVLQLNNQNGTFSEIGRYSGVSRTDWSWGALIFDMDNDGWKDIFVANGIYKDLLDRDYLNIYSDPSMMRTFIRTEKQAIIKLVDMIPSVKIPNYAFHNLGNLTFENKSADWGLDMPSFSNGAAWGDLDNDGDPDLVINNVNMPPFIYRNNSDKKSGKNYIEITLKGNGLNTSAIGASVTAYYDSTFAWQELYPQRGFMSSMDPRFIFGIGKATIVDSLVVKWPDGNRYAMHNINSGQTITINHKESGKYSDIKSSEYVKSVFKKNKSVKGFDFINRENVFNDFSRDKLLFQMMSNEGPHLAVSDVNGDGLEDLFICGSKGEAGKMLLQDTRGGFHIINEALFARDKLSEDTDCTFFDADGDHDPDLYVTSGGYEFPSSSSALRDRLYINEGKGIYTKSNQMLPVTRFESSSCVEAADFDLDGDMDLFVGIRFQPFSYGIPVNGYLLENNGKGKFTDVSDKNAPGLKQVGMITCMKWADMDNDGDQDMIIAGDWMPVKIFINTSGIFTDESVKYGLQNTEGWWHTILAEDVNGDGRRDIILGNQGLNSYFKASDRRPVYMFINDFDMNGSVEQIICTYEGENLYPMVMRDDLISQIPSLASKIPKFENYKESKISDIFPETVLKRSRILKAVIMESCIFLNSGGKAFKFLQLPAEAQFSPVYSILCHDFDNDGIMDILLGGNQYNAKPQTGIYSASFGLLLKGEGQGRYKQLSPMQSGICIKGQIRDLELAAIKNKQILLIALNNDSIRIYDF